MHRLGPRWKDGWLHICHDSGIAPNRKKCAFLCSAPTYSTFKLGLKTLAGILQWKGSRTERNGKKEKHGRLFVGDPNERQVEDDATFAIVLGLSVVVDLCAVRAVRAVSTAGNHSTPIFRRAMYSM